MWIPGVFCGCLGIVKWGFSILCQGCVGVHGSFCYKWKRKYWYLIPQPIRGLSDCVGLVWQRRWKTVYIGLEFRAKMQKKTSHWEIAKKSKQLAGLRRDTTCTASWRPWPSSSSVLFSQCAGLWEVSTVPWLEQCMQLCSHVKHSFFVI